MGVLWRDVWVRFKVRPSTGDVIHVISGWLDTTLKHPFSTQVLNVLDQHYPREEWERDLKKVVQQIAQQISEGRSRREQARICRVQILKQIEASAIHKIVMALDDDLRDYWLSVEYADKPYTKEQRVDIVLIKEAFDPLILTAIHGLYVSQYNSILNEEEFSEPYKIICEGYCEVLAKTIFARSDYGLLTCSSSTTYNDMIGSLVQPRLYEVKKRMESAIELGDIQSIQVLKIDAAKAFEEYQDALDCFNIIEAST